MIYNVSYQLRGGSKNNGKKSNKKLYIKNLSEPWFTLIYLGNKSVEGRLNKGEFKEMKVNDEIKWINKDFNHREFVTRIVSKKQYSTFKEYLEGEGLDKCLPGILSLEDGLSVYYKYYSKEDESSYGIIAIRLEVIN
jgi:ASC-1-like (ASCH) protein